MRNRNICKNDISSRRSRACLYTSYCHKLGQNLKRCELQMEELFSVLRTKNSCSTAAWWVCGLRATVNHVMIESLSLKSLKQVWIEFVTYLY